MSAFAILPAALTGFRFTREQPRALLLWAGAALAVSLLDGAATVATGAQGAANRLRDMQLSGSPDAAVILDALPRLAPALAVSFVLNIGLGAVLLASVFRAELGVERRATVAFGTDERRMAMVLIALLVVQLIAAVPVGLMAGIAAAAAGGLTAPVLALSQAMLTVLTGVAMVRLALAPPAVVAGRTLGLAQSLRATRGRFWPLLGALAAAAGLAGVVALLADLIFSLLLQAALAGAGRHLDTAAKEAAALKAVLISQKEGWAAFFSPGVLAARVFGALLLALVLPILAGPVAAAYAAFGREELTPASAARPASPPAP